MSKIPLIERDLPTVSFVICTLNCKDFTQRCLKSIRAQDYPQNKIEIVVVDSYSTDGTIETAQSLGARVILTKIRGYMEGKGMPKAIGCSKAKGDIVITIDSDNKLVEKDWIRKMIYPLMTDDSVNYSICRMALVKSDPLINQYLSLVGTDPFAIPWSLDPQISLGNVTLRDKGFYWTYENEINDFLITGGYYLAFRKKDLIRIGGYTRDVDVAYRFAKNNGHSVIAIAKDAHLHHLITKNSKEFLSKKMKWGRHYFTQGHQDRELKWIQDTWSKFGKANFAYQIIKNLLFFPAFASSIVLVIRDREKAWFMHAPLVLGTTAAYLIVGLKSKLFPAVRS